MSGVTDHQLLQRLIVRFLHDPDFTRAAYEEPQIHLEPLGLSAEALSWILSVDLRRWSLDTERAHRSLEGVIVHCPVTTALFVSAWSELTQAGLNPASTLELGSMTSSVEALLTFFKSERFHSCISERGHLADAFMEWLDAKLSALLACIEREGKREGERKSKSKSKHKSRHKSRHKSGHKSKRESKQRDGQRDELHAYTSLERGLRFALTQLNLERALIAQRRVRLSPRTLKSGMSMIEPITASLMVSLPETHMLVTSPAGSADLYSALYQATSEMMSAEGERGGQAALLRPRFKLGDLGERAHTTRAQQDDEVVLVERNVSGASVESLSAGLAQVLTLAQRGCHVHDLIALLERSGVSREDALDLLRGWTKDKLLNLTECLDERLDERVDERSYERSDQIPDPLSD